MITGTTKLAAVLGFPVAHSRSPQMMNAAFAATGIDAAMIPLDVSPENFAAAIGGRAGQRRRGGHHDQSRSHDRRRQHPGQRAEGNRRESIESERGGARHRDHPARDAPGRGRR